MLSPYVGGAAQDAPAGDFVLAASVEAVALSILSLTANDVAALVSAAQATALHTVLGREHRALLAWMAIEAGAKTATISARVRALVDALEQLIALADSLIPAGTNVDLAAEVTAGLREAALGAVVLAAAAGEDERDSSLDSRAVTSTGRARPCGVPREGGH